MNDAPTHTGALASTADAVRAAGFTQAAPGAGTSRVTLTAATARAAVLVRITPQTVARHAFVTLICATCRRHRACGWRVHLGADVPPEVVAATANAALSAPLPCETRCNGA